MSQPGLIVQLHQSCRPLPTWKMRCWNALVTIPREDRLLDSLIAIFIVRVVQDIDTVSTEGEE